MLTGYQDEESPGRRLQEVAERGSGSIRLGQDKIDVQCRLGAYAISAHADEGQIISLVETLGPEHVALVHGDEAAQASLEKALVERGRIVHRPHAGQSLQFGFADRKVLGMQAAERDLRTRQAEVNRQRRERMQSFSAVAGKWLLIKGDPPTPARCLALESDRLWVEVAPGLEQGVYPEEVLVLLGEAHPRAEDLAVYMAAQPARAEMEPNQALAYANQHFPPEARLRKTGYRLDQNLLVLTFDFPDAARERFADQLASLEATTGWKVEVISETNQAALNALVRELLPEGWQIVKGPSIFRDQKRLSVTLQAPSPVKEPGIEAEMHSRFHEISGYTLDLIWAAVPAPGTSAPTLAMPGERMEINAAYRYIKDVLQGSTIYRTSQKGDEIVLSFISPQVGERYQEQIDDLEKQVGWRLSINPQPNQGAILEAARALVSRAGWTVVKGPGIYPDKAEVFICLSSPPEPAVLSELAESFESQTGFRLAIQTPASSAPSTAAGARAAQAASVEIPVKRIRLRPYHENLSLDPEKLNKDIERARRLGVTPPVAVRRLPDGYLLMDGLYRLRAAEALGLERIPALVE